jgi:hypothetical protein
LAKSYTLQGVVSKGHPPSIAGNNFLKFTMVWCNPESEPAIQKPNFALDLLFETTP